MNITSVLFVGVGGDGIITASNIVAQACMLAGFDVKKSEIHGMSQRGGSVSASVRFGDKVYSPTDKKGSVQFMFATEKVELLRWVEYLNPASKVIANDRIVPIIGQTIDENKIDEMIQSLTVEKLIKRKFSEDAKKLGNPRLTNTIMLGVLSKFLPIDEKYFFEAIDDVLPEKLRTVNATAFSYGVNLAKEYA
ncbi:indolepyruvate oxidoreductase subunit beta [Hippea alviniae]|uniref:indolepyruvate oxidoreductase subunit beta n=1 Tax=Hippea alviniae TaxID=1279027 RepID=UPI0003B490F8|nr:indolepyruvate oxidoreductase subunit beta [Hippea alviniae]